jgi:hypothetical protein
MVAASISAGSVAVVWAVQAADPRFSFGFPMPRDTIGSVAIVVVDIAVIAMFQAFMNRDLYRLMLASLSGGDAWRK